jgi:DUF1016 N-terminal domain
VFRWARNKANPATASIIILTLKRSRVNGIIVRQCLQRRRTGPRRIGREILQRQTLGGWGAKVIDQLVADLRRAFPDVTGLSPRNLKYMRAFAVAWPDESIVQRLVAQIPWGHCVRLLDCRRPRP